jgi:AraC-like DNA-binding protein
MISDRDGSLHEELRSSISSALKGVLLFEETVHAKEVAEKAEMAKTRFFATMGDGLKEPLAVILDKMNQLDAMIHDQGELSQPLGRAIEAVRDEMELQLEKTSLLFDYTLAQAGELELETKLFPFAPILASITSRWQLTSVAPARLPLLQGDEGRILQMMEILSAYVHRKYPGKLVITVQVEPDGIRCRLTSPASLKADAEGNQRLLFAHNIVLLHQGVFVIADHEIEVFLPLPNLGGLAPLQNRGTPRRLLLITSDASVVPPEARVLAERFRLEITPVVTERLLKDQTDVADGAMIFWDADAAGFDQFLAIKLLLQHGRLFRVPVVCYGQGLIGQTLGDAVTVRIRTKHAGPMVFWGPSIASFPLLADIEGRFAVDSYDRFRFLIEECKPSVVLLDTVDRERIAMIRDQEKTSLVPIVILVDRLPSEVEMDALCAIPQVVVCHAAVAVGPEFSMRLRDIAGGGDVLPSHTGALVKRALWYLEHHAASQVSRWKLADTVNVSEDYLTRVFHKELGLSPWEYLNRYRIQLACDLLVRTNLSLSEISGRTGFQDQAYFCRVFKKLKGCTPSALRNA